MTPELRRAARSRRGNPKRKSGGATSGDAQHYVDHAHDPMMFLSRLIEALRRYALDVQRSRDELWESTPEQALPPIPSGDRHSRSESQR